MYQMYAPFHSLAFSFKGFAVGKATERLDAFRKVRAFFVC